MTKVGIYDIEKSEIRKDASERVYRRQAAYDIEKGVWTAGSEGAFTDRFDPETMAALETPEEVLGEFQDEISSITLLVFPTDEVPGEVELAEQVREPTVANVE